MLPPRSGVAPRTCIDLDCGSAATWDSSAVHYSVSYMSGAVGRACGLQLHDALRQSRVNWAVVNPLFSADRQKGKIVEVWRPTCQCLASVACLSPSEGRTVGCRSGWTRMFHPEGKNDSHAYFLVAVSHLAHAQKLPKSHRIL